MSALRQALAVAGTALVTMTPLAAAPVAASAAAGPPTIEASWVESVTSTSALLRAKINPQGSSTHFHFEYLTEAAYEANPEADRFAGAASAPAVEGALGSGTVAVTAFANVFGLAPTTSYVYRPVARNAEGTVFGDPHVLTTSEATSVHRPIDGRGWEMVSPIDKGGGAVAAPESLFGGGDFQAATGPEAALTYSSATAFGEAAGAPPASQYVSRRGAAGWSTEDVSAPLESGGYGDEPDGVPYRIFSADLSRALMLNGRRCAVEGTCPPSYSLWEGSGFGLLPTTAGLRFEGASPDLRHVLFGAEAGLYEWSGGGLEAISSEAGAVLAAPLSAVSEDGRRVYWSQLEDGPIRFYEAGAPAKTLPETTGTGAEFQVASTNAALAFYTVGGELYRYDAATEARTAIASGVVGVLGISTSADTVYYQDASGLKQWRGGATTTVAAGAEVAAPSDWPPATGTARVSADGEHLAFLSAAEIPPFDNLDANSEEPDTELYLYGPPPGGGAARLACASCNPAGERPHGPATIPGALANGSTTAYKPRVLSASGNRVFFDTADHLVTVDTDSRPDVYEWEAEGVGDCTRSPGCVGLISGGRGSGGSFLDASADGADVYFLTGEALVGTDPGSIDAYDYRIGGGFPEPEPPFVCKGDACQALPSPPEDPTPGTLVKNSGNPPLKYSSEHQRQQCPKGKRKARRHGKVRCVKRHPLKRRRGGKRHAKRTQRRRG